MKRLKLLLFIFSISLTVKLQAQVLNYSWANLYNSSSSTQMVGDHNFLYLMYPNYIAKVSASNGLVVDALSYPTSVTLKDIYLDTISNSLYVIGYINYSSYGIYDIDPTSNVYNHQNGINAQDGFAQRFSSFTTMDWCSMFNGVASSSGFAYCKPASIYKNLTNQLIITSNFSQQSGNIDFDPGAGTSYTPSGYDLNGNISVNLDTNGLFIRTKTYQAGTIVRTPEAGFYYTYEGMKLEKKNVTTNLVVNSTNNTNVFTISTGGTVPTFYEVKRDAVGDFYIVGSHNGFWAKSSGGSSTYYSATTGYTSGFVAKVKSDLSYCYWVQNFNYSTSHIKISAMCIDDSNHVQIGSNGTSYNGTYLPGWVKTYDTNGVLLNTENYSVPSSSGNYVDFNKMLFYNHSRYASGKVKGTMDFDPSIGTSMMTGAGTEFIQKMNAMGCSAPVSPTNTTTIANTQICVGNTTTLTATGTGTISWFTNSAGGTSIASGSTIVTSNTLTIGSYTYYAEDYTCTNSASRTPVTFTVNPAPLITVNSGSICAGSSFTINPVGASTYTYSGGNAIVYPTSNASYTITGTSATGCTNTAISNVVVTTSVTPSILISTPNTTICGTSAAFTSTITNGGTPPLYQWKKNGSSVGSGLASYSPTSLVNGDIVSCILTSNATCATPTSVNSNSITMTVGATPTITVNSGSICTGSNFTINPTGASTYSYSGGNAIVNPTANASYTVTGTSVAGCTNSAVSSVTVNALPIVTVNSGSICSGSSFTITPAGAITYTINGGIFVVNPSANTTYSVLGTNAQGCASSVSALSNVIVNATPTITVNNGTICIGSSFTINPTGASIYSYSGGNAIVTPTSNASYTITGTSATGCTNTVISNVAVTTSVTPSILISTPNTTICSNSAAFTSTITNGGATPLYQWKKNGSSVGSGLASYSPTSLVNGDLISCLLTSNATCATPTSVVSNSITMAVGATPTITINSGSICTGSSFTITPTGASTYTYIGGNAIVTPTSNASYTVTGTSAAGCTNTAVSNVTVNALPIITATTNNSLICTGSTATLSVMGAMSYTWSTGSNLTSYPVTPTVTTSYSVIGTDGNGCTNNAITTQSVSLCTAINEITNENIISIFPNPNNGVFTIRIQKDAQLIIINQLGEIVVEQLITCGENVLDLQSQASGLYFVKVSQANSLTTFKVVKH